MGFGWGKQRNNARTDGRRVASHSDKTNTYTVKVHSRFPPVLQLTNSMTLTKQEHYYGISLPTLT